MRGIPLLLSAVSHLQVCLFKLTLLLFSLGFIFYVIANELFSTKSPTRVYEEALAICTSDARVRNLLGEPITGCGESTRRGRRTHIA